MSSSPWLSRDPTPFSAGNELYKWNKKQTTFPMTEKRILPAYGAWGPGRGVDTVQRTPTSAQSSAMLDKQKLLFLCPTRNKRACQAQKTYPLFVSAGESSAKWGIC